MMPTVRGVIAASTAAGSALQMSGRMSAKTGVAPVHGDGVAGGRERVVADDDLVAGPAPRTLRPRCSAEPQLLVASACAVPATAAANLASKAWQVGPAPESQPDANTADRLELLVADRGLTEGDDV